MGINYSLQSDPTVTSRAIIRSQPMSHKHAREIARSIKGKTAIDAISYLEDVLSKKRSIPFRTHNAGVGHRKDIKGWDAGRYPQKASRAFLNLLANAIGNAESKGLDGDKMRIMHVAAHNVGTRRGRKPRAFGRATPWNTTLVDVELILEVGI